LLSYLFNINTSYFAIFYYYSNCIAGDQVNKFISSVAFSPYIYTQKSSPHPTEGR